MEMEGTPSAIDVADAIYRVICKDIRLGLADLEGENSLDRRERRASVDVNVNLNTPDAYIELLCSPAFQYEVNVHLYNKVASGELSQYDRALSLRSSYTHEFSWGIGRPVTKANFYAALKCTRRKPEFKP